MIVLDASVAVEIVLRTDVGILAAERLRVEAEIHAPEHFHIEAVSALRGSLVRGDLGEPRAGRALNLLERLRVVRFPILPLKDAIWELRHQLTAYDAAYLALARGLDAKLLTIDGGLARAAQVEGRLARLAV